MTFENLCTECGINLGSQNPRQLCGKWRCLYSDEEDLLIVEEEEEEEEGEVEVEEEGEDADHWDYKCKYPNCKNIVKGDDPPCHLY